MAKKTKACLALIFVMMFVFVGCSSTASSATPDALPKLGMTVYSYANTYTSYIRKGIQNYIEQNGLAEIQVADAENDAAKQIEQIDAFIAQGVDGLIVMPVDTTSAVTMVEKARAADIPLVFVNKSPAADVLNSWEKTAYVGLTLQASGEMQAQMVVDHWNAGDIADRNGDGVLQYCTVMGDLGHPDAEARTTGNKIVLDASGIEHEELDLQIAGWDTTKAKDIADIWLGKWPNDLDLIISNNDAMALGVLEAVKQLGLDIPVVGINCLPEVHDMIINGEYFGSILSDPWKQAQAAVDLVLNAIKGNDWFDGNSWEEDYDPTTSSVRIKDVMITAENVSVAQEAYANCL